MVVHCPQGKYRTDCTWIKYSISDWKTRKRLIAQPLNEVSVFCFTQHSTLDGSRNILREVNFIIVVLVTNQHILTEF